MSDIEYSVIMSDIIKSFDCIQNKTYLCFNIVLLSRSAESCCIKDKSTGWCKGHGVWLKT